MNIDISYLSFILCARCIYEVIFVLSWTCSPEEYIHKYGTKKKKKNNGIRKAVWLSLAMIEGAIRGCQQSFSFLPVVRPWIAQVDRLIIIC